MCRRTVLPLERARMRAHYLLLRYEHESLRER
jgi:hypothetical protein